ncbi:MAG: hypothetical protein WC763_02775 [Candidatus Paceibacterota bacterium]|jgi:hypothetical protein
MKDTKDAHTEYREALKDGIPLDYLRGIATPGTPDAVLMKSVGMKGEHPSIRSREALERMVFEDYIRSLR